MTCVRVDTQDAIVPTPKRLVLDGSVTPDEVREFYRIQDVTEDKSHPYAEQFLKDRQKVRAHAEKRRGAASTQTTEVIREASRESFPSETKEDEASKIARILMGSTDVSLFEGKEDSPEGLGGRAMGGGRHLASGEGAGGVHLSKDAPEFQPRSAEGGSHIPQSYQGCGYDPRIHEPVSYYPVPQYAGPFPPYYPPPAGSTQYYFYDPRFGYVPCSAPSGSAPQLYFHDPRYGIYGAYPYPTH